MIHFHVSNHINKKHKPVFLKKIKKINKNKKIKITIIVDNCLINNWIQSINKTDNVAEPAFQKTLEKLKKNEKWKKNYFKINKIKIKLKIIRKCNNNHHWNKIC